jgi:nucleoside-diphosphate-sugar epimerase
MNDHQQIHAVTGVFGYSGKYIALKLLDRGVSVRTLTNSINRENPFGERISVYPYDFDQPEKLKESLEGVKVLYNTYWVRFNHRLFTHADAVRNSLTLFEAAKKAGVERIVHVSITNPSSDTALEYFQGKAILEKAVIDSGISYAILRPAVLFGKEDILINNIAWALRKLPVFGVFGDGSYGIQPIYIDDFADLAVKQGAIREDSIINAIGPESFTYKELVKTISRLIGKNRPIISVPPFLGYMFAKAVGWLMGDTFLTWEEIKGLMAGTLAVDTPPTGSTKLTEWVASQSDTLGKKYTSELRRRKDRRASYWSN